MEPEPQVHDRKSIRMKGYDYSYPGFYFVTLITQKRRFLFGEIDVGMIHLSEIGLVVERCWHGLVKTFADIRLDEFVLMPNHLHGIVEIVDTSGKGEAFVETVPSLDYEVSANACPYVQLERNPGR